MAVTDRRSFLFAEKHNTMLEKEPEMSITKANIQEFLRTVQRNTIEFEKSETNEAIPIGTSKIGGKPHLPKGFRWPYFKGKNYDGETAKRPLSFIAQFNMSETASFDSENLLPHSGFLYFFYELETMCWGFEPKDIGCAKVYYSDVPAANLCETSFPEKLDESKIVPEYKLSFRLTNSLPCYEEFGELFENDLEWDEYDNAAAEYGVNHDISPEETFKLLGYADLIQGSMLRECESVVSGIYCGSPKKLSDRVQNRIAAGGREWILLAQFGTLSDELMFGDCGCIYYYIRREDLKKRRFDKVHLILQCG